MISLSQESRIDLAPKTSWDRLPIAVIFQTKEATADKSGSFLIVDGWTRLLSGRRMVFETTYDLNDEHMCVHMSHPESDHQFFQIQVTEKWPSGDNCWRYDAQFIRLLSEADLQPEASHC